MRACRIALISFLALLIGLAVGCTQNQLNRAQEYELEGKNATALQLYQQLLARMPPSGPERAAVLNRIGDCLFRMDRIQEAFTTFQKVVEADPQNMAAHLRMGQMLLEADAPEKAREQATIVLNRTPMNTEALTLLGASWAASGNFDLAKQAYSRVLENDSRRTKVALALADIYNHEDEESKAEEILRTAAASEPRSALPWLALARLSEQRGDSHAAEDAYRRATAVEDTPETNLRLAQFLQRSARIAEAEQTLRKVDAQEPRSPVALADFQLLSGRPDDALEQYRKALNSTAAPEQKPQRWSFLRQKPVTQPKTDELTIVARMIEAEIIAASNQQGEKRKQAMASVRSRLQENRTRLDSATVNILESEVAMADDNLTLARLYANSAVELAPNSAPAHYIVGQVAAAGGDVETAQTEWQNALDQDGHFGPARLALAEDALARGDGEDADEQARLVVRDTPGDLQAILIFSRALLFEGKILPAAIMAQRAAALDPASAEPSLILGKVALKAGNMPQALLQFERALSLWPDSEEAIDGLLHVYQQGSLSYGAIQKMEKVAQTPPVSSTLLEISGRLYADHGWYTDAIRALQRTIDLDPKRVTAARALARLQASTGDFAGAAQSAIKAGVDARTLLTAYHAQNSGDWRSAAATYERALREGDQTGVAANNVAWLYAEHGSQLNRALALAETAAHASPNNPAVLDTLGFVHLQRREYSDAVKLLETAARLSAEAAGSDNQELSQQIRKHLSDAYMKSGQTKAALKLAQNVGPFTSH